MNVLCGIIVVRLYGLELEVDKVLGVEGALVRDLGLCGRLGLFAAVEVEVAGETDSACDESDAE